MQEEVAKYLQRIYEIPLLDFTNKLVVNLDCTSRLFEYEIDGAFQAILVVYGQVD